MQKRFPSSLLVEQNKVQKSSSDISNLFDGRGIE